MKIKSIIAMLLLAVMLMPAAFAETEEEWVNILLLGGDSRSTESYGRTDTIIVLSINRDSGEMKMTSIMRDTWVQLSEGRKGKINAANVYGGPEMTMRVVNEHFGLNIEKYVLVNMYDLVHIIDMFGGVDIEITEGERTQLNKYAGEYLDKISNYNGATSLEHSGMVHMNGLLAVSYMRIRYTDSDYVRVMRQQRVMIEVAGNAQNMEVDELMAMADEIFACVETNMTDEELKDLAMSALTVDTEEIGQYRVPADGTFESGTFDGTWMIRADFEKNKKLLDDFIYGE